MVAGVNTFHLVEDMSQAYVLACPNFSYRFLEFTLHQRVELPELRLIVREDGSGRTT